MIWSALEFWYNWLKLAILLKSQRWKLEVFDHNWLLNVKCDRAKITHEENTYF
jgi:hypothetical protein